jgi:hypothetical protein
LGWMRRESSMRSTGELHYHPVDDICANRDDAQPHIYECGFCVLCYAPSPSEMARGEALEKWARTYYESEGREEEE